MYSVFNLTKGSELLTPPPPVPVVRWNHHAWVWGNFLSTTLFPCLYEIKLHSEGRRNTAWFSLWCSLSWFVSTVHRCPVPWMVTVSALQGDGFQLLWEMLSLYDAFMHYGISSVITQIFILVYKLWMLSMFEHKDSNFLKRFQVNFLLPLSLSWSPNGCFEKHLFQSLFYLLNQCSPSKEIYHINILHFILIRACTFAQSYNLK